MAYRIPPSARLGLVGLTLALTFISVAAHAQRHRSRRAIAHELDRIHGQQRLHKGRPTSAIRGDLARLFRDVRHHRDGKLTERYRRAVWLEQATSRAGSRGTVELELHLSGSLAAKMNLAHGKTIGAAVDQRSLERIWTSKAGRKVIAEAAKKAGKHEADVSWKDLGAVTHRGESGQVHFLRELYRGGTHEQFFADRKLPHVKLRAGEHGVNARVEFLSPADRHELRGVEVHKSGRAWASELSRIGADFAKSVGPQRDALGQHIHITFARRTRAVLPSFRRADHFRRSCLALELFTVSRYGELAEKTHSGAMFFDYSKPAQLDKLFAHLRGQRTLRPNELKISTIGYRTAMYTGRGGQVDRNIDGYELRALALPLKGRDFDAKMRGALIDAIQRGATRGSDGIGHGEVKAWYGEHVGSGSDRAASAALAQLHYNGSVSDALARLHKGGTGFTSAMQRAANAAAGWLTPEVTKQHYALKMLVHPWSKDTIFRSIRASDARFRAINKAHDAQVCALDKLAKLGGAKDPTRKQVKRILAEFVRDSGLLDVTARSLGAQHFGY